MPTPDQPITRTQFLTLQAIQASRGHVADHPDVVISGQWGQPRPLLARRDGDTYLALSSDPVPELIDAILKQETGLYKQLAQENRDLAAALEGRAGTVQFEVENDNDEENVEILNRHDLSELSDDVIYSMQHLIGDIHHRPAVVFFGRNYGEYRPPEFTFDELRRQAVKAAAEYDHAHQTRTASVRAHYEQIITGVQS